MSINRPKETDIGYYGKRRGKKDELQTDGLFFSKLQTDGQLQTDGLEFVLPSLAMVVIITTHTVFIMQKYIHCDRMQHHKASGYSCSCFMLFYFFHIKLLLFYFIVFFFQ